MKSIVWLPTFLSERTRTELGRYAILDYLLKGENLRECSQHLSALEREEARAVMDSMRRELDVRLRGKGRTISLYSCGKRDAQAVPSDRSLTVNLLYQQYWKIIAILRKI